MSLNHTAWIWINGRLVRWRESAVHVSAHALHYGTGVFEGIRCYATEEGPAVFRLDAHLERLYASAAVYGLEIAYGREELAEAVGEVIERNEFGSCYIRPLAFFDSGDLGIRAHCPTSVAVLAWPWVNHLGDGKLGDGARVTVSPWVKFDARMMPTTAKACGQYLNSRLATQEAMSRGYDEALLLNAAGEIAEGAVENIFLVKGGRVLTNDERSSILLGITRDSVIRIARDLGHKVEIGALRPEDLFAADEAFFTGTAAEVMPIREVDGRVIGAGGPGPVTRRIQEVFFAATAGKDSRYRAWNHLVAPAAARV
jgi:branched-chain amino acid aminotransferase